ncbi:MAG TPA: hypothetical protein VFH73_06205 [Polyangia bacterium]|jgi:hypothetical protein|nr:hypothetical protein [Polyangia bacterium]
MVRSAAIRCHLMAFLAGVTAIGIPAAARAADAALAETLFQQARTLLTEGRTAEACEKFAESQRLDPATGTLLNLATCRQAEGKLASAWADFRAAEDSARRDGRDDRVRFAREHLAAIEPRLSYLTVKIASDSRVPGLDVRLDDVMIREAAWGVATPVDPGVHDVTAKAPGRAPFSKRITVGAEGFRMSVEIRLERLPEPVVAPAPFPVALTAPRPAASSNQAAPLSGLGLVAGGVGVTGMVVGTIFGLRAYSLWGQRNDRCVGDVCSREGIDLGNQADRSATIADVAFAVGLAGVGVGTYLLFFDDEPPAKDKRSATAARRALTPLVAPGAAGLTLGGSW